MNSFRALILLSSFAGLLSGTEPAAAPPMPTDAEIRRILVDRIDLQHQGVGIVVGVIEPEGQRVVAYGNLSTKASQPVDRDTIFEIGSATKVFTALLLADAVRRGEVALNDPVAKYLPAGVKVPRRGDRQITLEDLATHTSGLPRLPTNLAPKDPANPYADYTVAQLYGFLSSYELTRDIGSRYEYSNLGAGLLGHALALRAGSDYETLIRSRVTAPLGMSSTVISLPGSMNDRLARGHNAQLEPVPGWDIPTLAGAGALRSTAGDLLRLLAAELGYVESPLAPAMASMLAARRPTGAPRLTIGLGWHVLSTQDGREIVWHNGGTGGFRSFAAFDRKARTGVVVLSNTFTDAGVDDIGRHLLDPSQPLIQPPAVRTEISLTPEQIDRLVGNYELVPGFVLTVTREGNRAYLQATGQPRFELFAESERQFFLKAVDAQVTFEAQSDGRATRLILHQNGAHQPAKRVE
jgi:D-alanyl-D-alanine-carboxypeptidase/D-alanyl-D-alanine-endopeptidase